MSYASVPSSILITQINTALDGIYKYRDSRREELKKEYIKKATNAWLFPLSAEEALLKWPTVYENSGHSMWLDTYGRGMENELKTLRTLCDLGNEVMVSDHHAAYLERPYERWGL